MSDTSKSGYEKPVVERYGDFRELTRLTAGDMWCDMYGFGCDDGKSTHRS